MSISREEAIAWPSNRSLKIVAGAGTGKTRFLMERFLHLVLKEQIPANRILGLTFTRKAAQELEERIREELGAIGESESLHIHTFDSFWLQLLLDHPAESKIEEPVLILDNGLSSLLQQRMVEEIQQGTPEMSLTSFQHMNLTNLQRAVSSARNVIHSTKLRLLSADQISQVLHKLRKQNFPTDPNNKELAAETISFIQRVAQLEERLLAETKALDYGEILLRAFKHLASNLSIRRRVQRRYRHILIDEAQDTNFGQFALLKYIAADEYSNMTVVGDVRQSIFGFRDANPKSLQDFEASTCTLGKNYRSYQPMLDLAVRVLEKEGDEGAYLLQANIPDSSQPTVAGFVAESALEENRLICKLIQKAIDIGIDPGEIAVLARTRATLAKLESILRKSNIPTTSLIGGFYRRPEILDARAYLAYLLNPEDRSTLTRILESSPHSYSLFEIYRIYSELAKNEESFQNELLSRLSFAREQVIEQNISLSLRWFRFLEAMDYFSALAAQKDSQKLRAQANLRKLFELTYQLTSPPISLSDKEVLDYLTSAIESEEDEPEADIAQNGGVVLTTIHRAKGLQFPIVIYCGVRDKPIRRTSEFFAHLRTTMNGTEWEHEGAGLLLPEDFEDSKVRPSPDEGYKQDVREEEKRLDYVALTRAQKLQIVSGHVQQGRRLPSVLEILNEFSETFPDNFVFFEYSDTESIASLLPQAYSEDEKRGRTDERPRTIKKEIISLAPPILRWSFSDFEEEYQKQSRQAFAFQPEYSGASQSDSLKRGTAIHEALRLSSTRKNEETDLNSLHLFSEYSPIDIANWLRVAANFARPDVKHFVEYPFDLLIEVHDMILRLKGVLDRIEIHEGKGRIIDFKTGHWNEEAEARARRQLNFYSLIWLKDCLPEIKELELCIIHIDEERLIPIPLDIDFEQLLLNTAKNSLAMKEKVRVIH